MAAEPGAVPSADGWSDAYLRARAREGRLLPDDVVARLPDTPPGHPLAWEWRQRGDSADRLCAYIGAQPRSLRVIDGGCGNGWLANRIATIERAFVTGVDRNGVELDQARRVFGGWPNLDFVAGDLLDGVPGRAPADLIVLASVIQYLPDLAGAVETLLVEMAPDGELHILDSPLYGPDAVTAARQQTRSYYADVGVPEMAEQYHHHVWDELAAFRFDVLYRPDGWRRNVERRLLRRPRSPFPWIRIRAGADR
jgi:SAM-dependent methyltransferase